MDMRRVSRQKPVSEEWLRERYLVDKLHCTQIATLVSRDAKTVWSWLREFGIPTRPRGMNKAVQFRAGVQTRLGIPHTQQTKDKLRIARIVDGRFPKQPDGRPYWSGKTGEAHPVWAGGATPERQAFYASGEWLSARKCAYTNAKGRCQKCAAQAADGPLHIHHVMPFVLKIGRADVRNLRVLCAPCHRWVHSPANGNREFLPPFGIFPLTENGITKWININYRPKHEARLPLWLTP